VRNASRGHLHDVIESDNRRYVGPASCTVTVPHGVVPRPCSSAAARLNRLDMRGPTQGPSACLRQTAAFAAEHDRVTSGWVRVTAPRLTGWLCAPGPLL
jgi:hypothetical protein